MKYYNIEFPFAILKLKQPCAYCSLRNLKDYKLLRNVVALINFQKLSKVINSIL